jgi:glycosyltransferase involved in cell wall biosynthesis
MKISIITVVRNNVKTIQQTIESVLSQEYKNIEYIIIDGDSTDGTLEIIKSFRGSIDKFISEKDQGLYDAMNKGINLASGDVVGFLHSDDFYFNSKVLSTVINTFKEYPKVDACYADLIYIHRTDTSRIIRYWKSSDYSSGIFSKGWSPPHPTLFIRKKIYQKYGDFDLSYHISSDIELMIRFIEVYKIKVKYVPHLWVKMRIGGLSSSGIKNILKQNKEVLSILKSYKLANNIIVFFLYKVISRLKQLLQRPIN